MLTSISLNLNNYLMAGSLTSILSALFLIMFFKYSYRGFNKSIKLGYLIFLLPVIAWSIVTFFFNWMAGIAKVGSFNSILMILYLAASLNFDIIFYGHLLYQFKQILPDKAIILAIISSRVFLIDTVVKTILYYINLSKVVVNITPINGVILLFYSIWVLTYCRS